MRAILILNMANRVFTLDAHDSTFYAELIALLEKADITCEADLTDSIQSMMYLHPERFNNNELDLMLTDLLGGDACLKILERLANQPPQTIEDMLFGDLFNTLRHDLHHMVDIPIPEEIRPDLKESLNSHSVRPERSLTKYKTMPRRSHRSLFPGVPSRHGAR